MDPAAFIDAVIDRMVERGLVTPKREVATITLPDLATEAGVSIRTMQERLRQPRAPQKIGPKLCIYPREKALAWVRGGML